MYIPVSPLTVRNAEFLAQQRDAFLAGTPGPDFGGGVGESKHVGRPSREMLEEWTDAEGLSAMGLGKLRAGEDVGEGERRVVERANEILGF